MDLFFGLVALFFLFLNFFIKKIFLIALFYFIIFFLFFLPFLLSQEADRVLVLCLGVRPEPLRWESQVQDTGAPETSQPHVI